MSSPDASDLTAILGRYVDPYLEDTLDAAGALQSVTPSADSVHVRLQYGFPIGGYANELASALEAHLASSHRPMRVTAELEFEVRAREMQRALPSPAGIKNIVAVASGKGGVGKSTVAANLALAWAAQGARVGLLDADIYGPSQPLMLGLTGQRPRALAERRIEPLEAHGVRAMSIGFLIDAEQPMAWRGPMVTQALTQLFTDTAWGELDYLVVDMPPGTGDIQLTLSQRVPVAGAVIVTTPQDIALADARKGLRMFEKVEVPVLGIVENMSLHTCSNCGHTEAIFGAGGAERMAKQYAVPVLGQLPLDARIREEADSGRPSVVAAPDSPRAQAYLQMARRTAARLARLAKGGGSLPRIVVEQS